MLAGAGAFDYREDGVERRHDLPAVGNWTVGRYPPNDLALTDPYASRSHAEVRIAADGSCVISDRGSRKGTYVNGRPITATTRLRDGDIVLVGATELIFRQGGLAVEAASIASGGDTTEVAFDQQLVTILVIDIRGSTALGRMTDAGKLASVMGSYNDAAIDRLAACGAWGQKLTGDGLMALWTHPALVIPRADLARVVACALDLGQLLADTTAAGLGTAAKWGAGINSGFAKLGNMGGRRAQDFMPVSETGNRAFRLEAATKATGTPIVMGRTSLDLVDPHLATVPPLEYVKLTGYDEPEPAYPLDLDAAASLLAELRSPA